MSSERRQISESHTASMHWNYQLKLWAKAAIFNYNQRQLIETLRTNYFNSCSTPEARQGVKFGSELKFCEGTCVNIARAVLPYCQNRPISTLYRTDTPARGCSTVYRAMRRPCRWIARSTHLLTIFAYSRSPSMTKLQLYVLWNKETQLIPRFLAVDTYPARAARPVFTYRNQYVGLTWFL